VIRRTRGGPGCYDERLARAEQLSTSGGTASAPLAALVDVLHHQRRRAADPDVAAAAEQLAASAAARREVASHPLLDLDASLPAFDAEVMIALAQLAGGWMPTALDQARLDLRRLPATERRQLIAAWLVTPDIVEPPSRFWIQSAAGPLLELAAAAVKPPPAEQWHKGFCLQCGGPAQTSVIAEESGEFLGGSPRSLVCARCATWWSYPRATCPVCGEDDPRRVTPFVQSDDRRIRIDACKTCHRYIKTFDLRETGAAAIVPLVDDVATMTLDLWARDQGFERASPSLAGV
jgi:formate dehydrogenase maturation protein FdhE